MGATELRLPQWAPCIGLIQFNLWLSYRTIISPHKLAKRLSAFWINMFKKYKRSMLTDDQIRWIVKQKVESR